MPFFQELDYQGLFPKLASELFLKGLPNTRSPEPSSIPMMTERNGAYFHTYFPHPHPWTTADQAVELQLSRWPTRWKSGFAFVILAESIRRYIIPINNTSQKKLTILFLRYPLHSPWLCVRSQKQTPAGHPCKTHAWTESCLRQPMQITFETRFFSILVSHLLCHGHQPVAKILDSRTTELMVHGKI